MKDGRSKSNPRKRVDAKNGLGRGDGGTSFVAKTTARLKKIEQFARGVLRRP